MTALKQKNSKAIQYLTKAKLYDMVDAKAHDLGLNLRSQNYRLDSLELAMRVCHNLEISFIEFETSLICGVLIKGKNSTTIGLNARRSKLGKNFDCMHELIHYWFHGDEYFLCDHDAKSHLEWQANEGAAQFLMPYQSFIPNYSQIHDYFYENLSAENANNAIIARLSTQYLVGETAVKYRINGLQNEIKQYLNGIQIERIQVLARGQK